MAKILIVDDERWYLEGLSIYLKHKGHEITYAATGNEALKLLGIRSFDVILLDVMMPWSSNLRDLSLRDLPQGKNCGIDLTQKLRGEKKISTPIILHTVLPEGDDIKELYKLGKVVYKQKGTSNKEIEEEIGRLLQ